MWLHLKFYKRKPSILIAVIPSKKRTREGLVTADVYFRASDVGRYLGYVCPHSFAKHSKTNLLSLIPKSIYKTCVRLKQFKVFTFEGMIDRIEKSRKKHNVLCSEEEVDRIKMLWNEGRVAPDVSVIRDGLLKPFIRAEDSFTLRVGTQGQSTLHEFINAYAIKVEKMFRDIQIAGRLEFPFSPANPNSMEVDEPFWSNREENRSNDNFGLHEDGSDSSLRQMENVDFNISSMSRVQNADGSSVSQVENADSSSLNLVENVDTFNLSRVENADSFSMSRVENADSFSMSRVENADGSSVSRVENVDGSSVSRVENVDGSSVSRVQNANGSSLSQVENINTNGSSVHQVENGNINGSSMSQIEVGDFNGSNVSQVENINNYGSSVHPVANGDINGSSMSQVENGANADSNLRQVENGANGDSNLRQVENGVNNGILHMEPLIFKEPPQKIILKLNGKINEYHKI